MPRTCTVCSHDEGHSINVALVQPTRRYRTIADEFEVSQSALKRHAAEHLPELLVKARDSVEAANADNLLSEVRDLHRRTLAILDAAESEEEYRTALAAIREARANVELLGRLAGELQEGVQFNLHLHPEYLKLEAVIIAALEDYPDALDSVHSAIKEVNAGG